MAIAATLILATSNGYAQAVNDPVSARIVKIAVPGNIFATLVKSRPTGVLLETLDLLLRQTKDVPSYITMPTDDAIKGLQEGTLDIATVIVPTPRVKEVAWLSDPIITEYSIVMVPKGKAFPFTRVSDLYNKRIGVRIGYQYPLLDSNENVNLSRYRSDGEMIRALLFDHVDAIMVAAISDNSTFRTEGILTRFEMLKMAVGTVPITVAFSKKHYTQQDVESFNRSLGQFKQSPDWQGMMDHNGLSTLVKDWPLITQ